MCKYVSSIAILPASTLGHPRSIVIVRAHIVFCSIDNAGNLRFVSSSVYTAGLSQPCSKHPKSNQHQHILAQRAICQGGSLGRTQWTKARTILLPALTNRLILNSQNNLPPVHTIAPPVSSLADDTSHFCKFAN